jgi:hypothetical protein
MGLCTGTKPRYKAFSFPSKAAGDTRERREVATANPAQPNPLHEVCGSTTALADFESNPSKRLVPR